ncbi:polyhydroxyalkanoate synthesis regulator DNA-binding domain-containing protein [bacterium]|nr:polyhydroxyalkanoate synthesis regulator DNA-binding domain-containing protein [bacterium]
MDTKIIKRYPNRKLYDTTDSCYVTLDDIGLMIKDGVNVQVLDNKTKDDLTSVTLAQIILEEEKHRKNDSSMEIFRRLIQSGGSALKGWMEFSFKGISEVSEVVSHYIDGMVQDGHIRREESHRAVDMIKDFIEHHIKPTVSNITNTGSVQSQIEDLQLKISKLEKNISSNPSRKNKRPKAKLK